MAERFFGGYDGGVFKLRVSKPGHDARTASLNNLALHEGQRPMVPAATGLVAVGSGGSAAVSLGIGFSAPPKVILRTASNRIASAPVLYCSLDMSSGVLTIFNNYPAAQTVRYVVFSPF